MFTGFTFLIGVFLFATVVGNVGDVISNLNAARMEFQGKYVHHASRTLCCIRQSFAPKFFASFTWRCFRMDGIKFYMAHHTIPQDLQGRVKKWAEYSWNRSVPFFFCPHDFLISRGVFSLVDQNTLREV